MAPKNKMGVREKRRAQKRMEQRAGPSGQHQVVAEQDAVAEQQVVPERAGPSESLKFTFSLPPSAPAVVPAFMPGATGFYFSNTAEPLVAIGDEATFATREISDEGPPREVLQDLLKATRQTLAAAEKDFDGMKAENTKLSNDLTIYQERVKEAENLLSESEDEVDKLHKQLADERETSAKKDKEISKLRREVNIMNVRHAAEVQISDRNERFISDRDHQLDVLNKQLADEREITARNVEKMAEIKRELDQQKQHLKEQVNKMAANQGDQQSVLEQLNAVNIEKQHLQKRYDILIEETDALQVKVAELEQSLQKTKSANAEEMRRKNNQISEHLATINAREEQLKTMQEGLRVLDVQLKEKDELLRSNAADYSDLNSEFQGTLQAEEKLIFDNDNLTEAVKTLQKENQRLQAAIASLEGEIEDRNALAAVLAEAEVNSKTLTGDIAHLEDQNRQLRSRLARIGHKREKSKVEATSRSLEDEVGGIEFFTSPSRDPVPSEVTIRQKQPEGSMNGKERDILNAVGTEIPDIQELKPVKSAKSDASNITIIPGQLKESGNGNEQEAPKCIETKIVYIERPSNVTYITHNPIACWFQVEWDLLILLILLCQKILHVFLFLAGFFRTKKPANILDNTPTGTPKVAGIVSPSVRPEAKVGTTIPEIQAISSSASTGSGGERDVKEASDHTIKIESFTPPSTTFSAASVVATASPGATEVTIVSSNLDCPPVLRTLGYFFLHVLFYFFILMCAWSYSSLRSEIHIWHAANEFTYRLFSHYYGSNRGRQCYGIFHHTFGEVDLVRKLHFTFYLWSKVNRAFPG